MGGREANFLVFDTEVEQTVDAGQLHTRHAISPYVGEQVRGRVVATYLRGEAVWSDGGFAETPHGREIRV